MQQQQPYQQPMQHPMQQQPPGMSPGGRPPGMPGPMAKKKPLPSVKKKRLLRILVGLLIFTTLSAVVTMVYFYANYVR